MGIRQISLISVALLLTGWSATAGIPRTRAQQEIEKIVETPALKTGAVGILAVRMDGDTIACLSPGVRLVPASNVKLITTGLALRSLGSDFQFETRLAYSGSLVDGVLEGDLYIVGGGDPTTGSKSDSARPLDSMFELWRGLLEEAGIRRIEGRIIGDPRYFDSVISDNSGWTYDDLGTYYGNGPLGLNFFSGAQNFYVTPGSSVGARPFVTARYPDTPWMRYTNSAKTGKERSANTMAYISSPFGARAQFIGSFPIDRKGYTLECSNEFGAYTCAYYFYNHLKSKGISSKGYADVSPSGHIRTELGEFASEGALAPAQADLFPLGCSLSAPLRHIVSDVNRHSDNFYAEALLKTIGVRFEGSSEYEVCTSRELKMLSSMGLDTAAGCQLVDGSGLSRKNYVSPGFFVSFLKAMTREPVFGDFFDSLPTPGSKGTLETMFPNASREFRARLHFKSGSMNGVRCYSGYIEASDGDPSKTIVFSLMMNNLTAKTWAVTPFIQSIIETLASEN